MWSISLRATAIARIELGTSGVQIDRLWDLVEALSTTPSALLSAAEERLPRPIRPLPPLRATPTTGGWPYRTPRFTVVTDHCHPA